MSNLLFDIVKTQSKVTDSVIVGFSGGKDSIVTLDLCFKYFKNVKPFFMYLVPNLSFQEKMLSWYEKKYQTEITRIPHQTLSDMLHFGIFRNQDLTFPRTCMNDVYNYMRIENNIWWIAAGERIDDSLWRRAMIKHSSSIDEQRGRFYPVAYWNKNEIMQYIKFHKLYLAEDSKKIGFSFRFVSGREMYLLKQYFPDDYKKVLKFFPYAEAAEKRYELYGKK